MSEGEFDLEKWRRRIDDWNSKNAPELLPKSAWWRRLWWATYNAIQRFLDLGFRP